ncbi:MAG: NAD synthetase [Candidatus Nomurabacteria bacterium GW2011_GWB1_37_5]|uniref:Glutamine-dependent NAD(+) synthetase n=1 Tax=Candidatus Nomurabacteria bacterium GW2011_GWB1_37_5 TaxID=1618742 RepID=A0A0G0K071_9BACT|nr:MAG: NAD synthetase [Candidatus Nomurabacteria bacterium GW2011_GWB1_37_5]
MKNVSKQNNELYKNYKLLRVAAATPKLKVGDVEFNTKQIIEAAKKASSEGASLIVFPELSITGYTAGDLFQQGILLESALKAVKEITDESEKINSTITVGFPFLLEGKLFNMAAVISKGKLLGLVPKIHIPEYKEFYEKRWFTSGRELISKEITLFSKTVPIGTDLLFKDPVNQELILGIETCEDVWMPIPPSSYQSLAGAIILANLSASNEIVGKADYRRGLVKMQSGKTASVYIYSACGPSESTTDLVFSGHSIIAENGVILKESDRFTDDTITYADVDIERCLTDRYKTTTFADNARDLNKNFRFIATPLSLGNIKTPLYRFISPTPFLPYDQKERRKNVEEVFSIQVAGLAKRIEHSGMNKIVLGLSGGLDSTLAFLVALRALKKLNMPVKNLHAITMPGFGTTNTTKSNAYLLAEAANVSLEEINISKGSLQQFQDIGHNPDKEDVTYQNVQARYRTMILMNRANQIGGIVLGTGDLSEIALGWNTFTGDHISHYNVNASVPKTLVRYIVEHVAEEEGGSSLGNVLKKIIDTPISPELTKPKAGKISQKTEELIGPYELHDFFLYHFIRWTASPKKIYFMAQKAFEKKYSNEIIKKWIGVFFSRFFRNQWKRSVMPDGPKVGSVSLSPRGDWRMPSDAEASLWLNEIKNL